VGSGYLMPMVLMHRLFETYSTLGFYFIDRDPLYFPVVLNFLRYKSAYDVGNMNINELHKFAKELDYYQISVPDLDMVPQSSYNIEMILSDA
jgi:hypothetical protein